jgi:hypothetical protein
MYHKILFFKQYWLGVWIIGCMTLLSISACKEEDKNPCYERSCGSREICVEGKCVRIEEEQLEFVGPPAPRKIFIDSLVMKRFPINRPNGSAWDNGSKPDLYIQLLQGSTVLWSTSPSLMNADTVETLLFINNPIEIPKPENIAVINIYDDDGNNTDEYMAGVIFTVYKEDNQYPVLMTAENSLVEFTFRISYQF